MEDKMWEELNRYVMYADGLVLLTLEWVVYASQKVSRPPGPLEAPFLNVNNTVAPSNHKWGFTNAYLFNKINELLQK